jgi:hypothetical protein
MKINISNPNTKSETKNYIQHVLQVYILCTCHEITQVVPPPFVVCFHPTMTTCNSKYFYNLNAIK